MQRKLARCMLGPSTYWNRGVSTRHSKRRQVRSTRQTRPDERRLACARLLSSALDKRIGCSMQPTNAPLTVRGHSTDQRSILSALLVDCARQTHRPLVAPARLASVSVSRAVDKRTAVLLSALITPPFSGRTRHTTVLWSSDIDRRDPSLPRALGNPLLVACDRLARRFHVERMPTRPNHA